VIPGLASAFLLLLPWLDRAPSASLRARWPVALGMAGLLGGASVLTALALYEDATDPAYQEHVAEQAEAAAFALEHAADGFTPLGAISALEGRRLFSRLACDRCHTAEGEGGDKGPRLDGFASRAWFRAQLEAPDAPDRFGGTRLEGEMPSFAGLPEETKDALVEMLASRTGLKYTPPLNPALVAEGREAFEADHGVGDPCVSCHTLDGTVMIGPTLQGYGSDDWLGRLLSEPGADTMYGGLNDMPPFAYLPGRQVEQLVAYLRALRGAPARR